VFPKRWVRNLAIIEDIKKIRGGELLEIRLDRAGEIFLAGRQNG
jgi:hypothetical protein